MSIFPIFKPFKIYQEPYNLIDCHLLVFSKRHLWVQIPLTYSIKLCFNSSTQLLDGYKPDMERWKMYRYNAILSNIGVRLNLINHFVGFISCQFACNSTLRNPVFRWESCKGSVLESVKKCSRLCTEAGTRDWILRVAHDWILRVAHDWQVTRGCTRVKHVEKLNRHANCSIIGQKVQTGHSVSSRLELVTQSSHEAKSLASSVLKNWLFAFHSHTSINTPYTHEM